jgi:SAM-dependent methyltransferase
MKCIICNSTHSGWLPHPAIAARSSFCKLMNVIGSDLVNYLCPICRCNDRDRHLWLYMTSVSLVEKVKGLRILHLAPEASIEKLLSSLEPMKYVRGDLTPRQQSHIRIDVQQIPFGNEAFDLIICNHVLEHVESPSLALKEFFRVLSTGGHLIAQTPFTPSLKYTMEFTDIPTPSFAKLFFGQEDHVRLFGRDLVRLFECAGFSGEFSEHSNLLEYADPLAFGVNRFEPFMYFRK